MKKNKIYLKVYKNFYGVRYAENMKEKKFVI